MTKLTKEDKDSVLTSISFYRLHVTQYDRSKDDDEVTSLRDKLKNDDVLTGKEIALAKKILQSSINYIDKHNYGEELPAAKLRHQAISPLFKTLNQLGKNEAQR